MSIRVPLDSLDAHQLIAIKLCCTYFFNPIKDRDKSKVSLDKLGVSKAVKDFATMAFFSPLDPLLIKYLGNKLYQQEKFGASSATANNCIRFYDVDQVTKEIILPYSFGRILVGSNPNKLIQYSERPFIFTGNIREEQVEPIKILIDQIDKFGSTTVGLPTGFGKTVIGAYISSQKKLLTCILICNVSQIKQWRVTYANVSNAKVFAVGEKDNKCDIRDADVLICMDKRIVSIPGDVRKNVGMLIIDEAHSFCTEGRQGCWLSFQPRYLILETATIIRPDDAMERMCYAGAGIWGFNMKSQKKFNFFTVKTGIKPERVQMRGPYGSVTNYDHLLKTYLYEPQILDIVTSIIAKNTGRKVFILTSRKDSVEFIGNHLKEKEIVHGKFYGNMKTYEESMILIGTISKMGQAFDEATFSDNFNGVFCDVLILVVTIKKYLSFMQTIGRAMRSQFPPDIYQLVGEDSIFMNHVTMCRWFIKNYTNGIIH
jgi:hypothetical protein